MAATNAQRSGPKSKVQSDAGRDAATLARLEEYIDQILAGHVTCTICRKEFEAKELQPSAVALLKARYDKLRPSLSAVEQTASDPFNGMNRQQLLDSIRELLKNPSIARELGVSVAAPVIVKPEGDADRHAAPLKPKLPDIGEYDIPTIASK